MNTNVSQHADAANEGDAAKAVPAGSGGLFKVAAIQMVSSPQTGHNIGSAQALVKQAAEQGAKLVLLPEYWPIMGMKDTDKLAIAERLQAGEIQRSMAAMAKDNGIWLIGGTLPLATDDPGKVYNTTLVYNPAGEVVTRYDKIHLFSFSKGEDQFEESRTIERGGPPVFAPKRQGFGTRLLERGVARDLGGEASLNYSPKGLTYMLRVPLSDRVAAGPITRTSK